MAANRARRNAVRFSAVEDVKMDGLLFSRSVLQKELGFRPDQIDYLFAFPGGKVFEVIFTTFALFEQCLKRFKERNDSAPLKVFSINALTQPQKRWVNVSMFNEYVQSADIITWLNQFCVVSHGERVRDADGVKTGYFKALVSLKRDRATEELRHIPSTIRLGGATGTVFYVGQPRRCRKCNLEGHLAKDCTAPFCTKCRNTGHEAVDCVAEKTCNLCGSTEHEFKNCPSSYAFKIKAARLEQPFTPHQSKGRSREDVVEEEEELIRLGLEEERLALQPGLSLSEAKVDLTVKQDTSGERASVLAGKQAGAVDEAGNCMEPNEGDSPGAPDQPIMATTPDLNLAVQSQQTSSKTTGGGGAQHHLGATERNGIISAGGSSLISTTGAALDAPQVQPVPLSAPQPHGTVMDDSLYVTPEVFSTPSQHSLEPASSGTANAVGTQGTVSTISSIDSCSELEFACTALEHSSFSDTAVAAEVVEWGKDDIFVEEEVESAMDVSTSLKRKEKEGDNTEETGFESNDSRDLCAQDVRRNSQAVTGEDAFTPVIKRKTKKRNRKLD
ncbi:hypothetical protein NDU88_005734 [Pleurodeles waltl]|uniref:CCHC-type domain-containing protein n=1 Tax=Pleurodeles waltl TaxID=8319 RepID=A0AAV7VP79_PLEWA|nr:hypothetical protein NDU88_005734 [Pleurodeles waltl]